MYDNENTRKTVSKRGFNFYTLVDLNNYEICILENLKMYCFRSALLKKSSTTHQCQHVFQCLLTIQH